MLYKKDNDMKCVGVLILSVILCLIFLNGSVAKAQSGNSLYFVPSRTTAVPIKEDGLSEQPIKQYQIQTKLNKETVTGTVTDARTDDPLVGVNILVIGTSTGAATDANGRFSLTVSSLEDSLRFTYIGYKTKVVPINGRTEVNVTLQSTSTELSQLVVTGVGIRTEKKRLGNSVGVIQTKNLQNAPIEGTVNLIKGRIPSVVVTKQGGYLGSGSSIRIRGSASLSLSNQPLVYVNGIRLANSSALSIGDDGAFAIQSSRLNDISSSTILNMNVLKGASAATLYGSEANNGILEITTKSGKPGETVLSFNTTQRIRFIPDMPSSTVYDAETNTILHSAPIGQKRLDNSYIQNYNIALSGGSDETTYYISTMYAHGLGLIPTTKNGKFGVQSHIHITPNDMVDVSLFMAYIKSHVSSPATEGSFNSYVPGLLYENPLFITKDRPYGTLFIPLKQLRREKLSNNVKDILLGTQIHAHWLEGLESTLSIGTNKIIDKRRSFFPIGHPSFPKGRLTQNNKTASMWTLNFNTSWETDINDNVSSKFLVGGQAYFSNAIFIVGETGDFSSENITVLRGGSTIFNLDQSKIQIKNAGYFVQEQVGLWDQLYLTGGVRFDASSAFGSNLSTVVYPKVGVSYNVPISSSEALSSVRLRGSFGTSGLQPGAFDAQRTYVPTSYGDGLKGIDPGNLGNDELAPERSKAFEFGADMGFFNENLNVSLTYFNQRTEDALLRVQSPPSEGFLNPQLTNVGEISSKGFEMKVNWSVLHDKNKTGSIGFNISTLNQKVEDMGGAAPFSAAPNAQRSLNKIQVGYQPGAALGPVVDPNNPYTISVPLDQFNSISDIGVNLLKDESGNVVNKFIGNMIPTLRGAVFLNFKIGRFIAHASIIGAHGAVMFNQTQLIGTQIGLTAARARIEKTLNDPGSTIEMKKKAARKWAFMDPTIYSNWYQSQDFIRFQSLTFGYDIPVNGINQLKVLLSVNNLFELTKYDGIGSPGTTGGNIHANFNSNSDYIGLPLTRSIQLKIQLKI